VISLMEQYEAIREDEMMGARNDGREEGARDAKLDDARAALRLGVSRDLVTAITGLDAAEVDDIARELALPISS